MSVARPPREPRRILLVSYEYPPLGGGGGVVFRSLAEELAERIPVTVLTSARRQAERERRGNLKIVRTPVWMRNDAAVASLPSMLSFFPSSLRTGGRLLREEGPFDLVHSAFAVPTGPSGLLLARRAKVPHVLSVLGGDLYDPSKRLSPHRTPLLKQVVRWVIRGSDRVVAESQDLADRARALYHAERVDRIPLAVRPISFARVDRGALELGLEADHIVLITVGRLIARKGLEQLIEVLAKVDDRRVRLLIVGDGPKRGTLERCARAAGVADRVRFTGFVSDERKWQLLDASDIYLSTSLHEGFGLAFLEAMTCGLPVISYDCGGQTDFLAGEFSHLVPLGDRGLFRERLVELLESPELRERMSEAARRAAKSYSIERLTDRYLEIYRQCLEGPSS